MDRHPVRITLHDDLRRSRLTVFFRLLLALPHIVWFWLWTGYALLPAAFLAWILGVALGRVPEFLHRFLASWVRYGFHVGLYIHLVANPFPGFIGRSGYPVDLVLPLEPGRQRRLGIFFRGLLVLPVLLLAGALAGFAYGGLSWLWLGFGGGAAGVVAFMGWFAALALGRIPAGLRDLGAYSLGYAAQVQAYWFLVVDRYPSSDPDALGPQWPLPEHPVRLELDDDGRRSRLTVLFRFLLALPHFVWLTLWGAAASVASLVNWAVTLVRGRPAQPLHRFLSAYVRYLAHVTAFVCVIANQFPGFTGARGYAVDVTLPPPERQSRWKTGFRLLLGLPALYVLVALSTVLYVIAFLAWFAALVRGTMPIGMRNLGAVAIRYMAQTYAYLGLVTDRYPYASPALRPPPEPEPEPEWAPGLEPGYEEAGF